MAKFNKDRRNEKLFSNFAINFNWSTLGKQELLLTMPIKYMASMKWVVVWKICIPKSYITKVSENNWIIGGILHFYKIL